MRFAMETYKTEFLNFVVKEEILQFGEFTLKSGRVSPYFFNAGLFNTGKKLSFYKLHVANKKF